MSYKYCVIFCGTVIAGKFSPAIAAPGGAAIYEQRCAVCHDHPTGRVPPRGYISTLRQPEEIIETLTTGLMKPQASGLSGEEIRSIAEFLTGKQPGAAVPVDPLANMCSEPAEPFTLKGSQWSGWGHDVRNTRFQSASRLKLHDVAKLKLKWVFAYPGVYALGQPIYAGDRLFVGSKTGDIFSLNPQTGCTYWRLHVDGAVRTGISVTALPFSAGAKFAAYFGEFEKGVIHAVDAQTGRPLWSTTVEDHPLTRLTASPVLYDHTLYVPVSSLEEVTAAATPCYPCCTFRGSIVALDALSGRILWKHYMIETPPAPTKKNASGTQMYGPAGVGIWTSPAVDIKRKLLYVATGNSYSDVFADASDAVVALDLNTGERKWVTQVIRDDNYILGCERKQLDNCPTAAGKEVDMDFISAPVLHTLKDGHQLIFAGSKTGTVYAFDPDDAGKILWKTLIGNEDGRGSVGYGLAVDETVIYVSSDAAKDVRNGERGPDAGRLTALDPGTGRMIWTTLAPTLPCRSNVIHCLHAQTAAVTAIPGVVFSGALDGHVRAYSSQDGKILWDFDTTQSFDAVNGVKAHGGAIGDGGQIVVDGMLYVNSGSGVWPGNALLAFSVGK